VLVGARSPQVWLPFYTPCADFVATQFPNLVAFSTRCTRSGGSTPVPPPPPMTGGDQLSLVDATFVVSAASSVGSAKKTNRYTTNFRADLADALNVNAYSILVDGVSATSVHVIIEGGDSQTILSRLQAQSANPNSQLRQAHAAGNTIVSVTAHVVTPPAPPPAGSGGYRTTDQSPIGHMHISVDNSYTAYVNGAEVGSGENWAAPDTHDFSATCHQPLVVGFHGAHSGLFFGFRCCPEPVLANKRFHEETLTKRPFSQAWTRAVQRPALSQSSGAARTSCPPSAGTARPPSRPMAGRQRTSSWTKAGTQPATVRKRSFSQGIFMEKLILFSFPQVVGTAFLRGVILTG